MNTCQTCTHWRRQPYHGLKANIFAQEVGECRGGPPSRDFHWPRSQASDVCAAWTPINGKVGTVKAPKREGRDGREGQSDIFGSGEPATVPAEILAYDAATGSTPSVAGPGPNQSARRANRKS